MHEPDAPHAKIVRRAGVVSAAVLFSRVTGLLRETVFAGLFGAGMRYDAFVAAFRIPNLMRDLLGEGALSAAFVKTYSQRLASDGVEEANRLSNRLTTIIVPLVLGICLAGVASAEYIVTQMFPGYASVEGKLDLTVTLARVMMPFLLFVALAAKAMGVLNSHNRFGIPALSSGFFNLTSVGTGVFIGFAVGPEIGLDPIMGMAVGTLLGGSVQYLCQVPGLRKTGLRYRKERNLLDPDVRQVLRLMGPAVIGAAAVQVNVFVNSVFASELTDAAGEVIDGPVSWLSYAFRFMHLPQGLFGFAVAAATLPMISQDAGEGRMEEFRSTLSRSLGLVFLLTTPAAVGLFVLSQPLIGLVFQHGQFTAEDTEQTAMALSCYCLGSVAHASTRLLAPAFYALNDALIPMFASLFAITLNFALNSFFVNVLGLPHWSLALSTSLVALSNFLVLFLVMRVKVRRIGGRRLLASGVKIAAASAAMGACCWVCAGAIEAAMGPGTFVARLAAVAVSIPLGVGVLYGLCRAMGLPELELAQKAVLERLGSRGRQQP